MRLDQIAKDFGIYFTPLYAWMKTAEEREGDQPAATAAAASELREAKKRIRLLEQENEVLRLAAAYLSQAHLRENVLPARP